MFYSRVVARRQDARPPPDPHYKVDTFTNRVEGGEINVNVRKLRHSVTGILANRKQLGRILIGLLYDSILLQQTGTALLWPQFDL